MEEWEARRRAARLKLEKLRRSDEIRTASIILRVQRGTWDGEREQNPESTRQAGSGSKA